MATKTSEIIRDADYRDPEPMPPVPDFHQVYVCYYKDGVQRNNWSIEVYNREFAFNRVKGAFSFDVRVRRLESVQIGQMDSVPTPFKKAFLGRTTRTIAETNELIDDFILSNKLKTTTYPILSNKGSYQFANDLAQFFLGDHIPTSIFGDEVPEQDAEPVYAYHYDVGAPYYHLSIMVFDREFAFNRKHGIHSYDARIPRNDGPIPAGSGSGPRLSGGDLRKHGFQLSGMRIGGQEDQNSITRPYNQTLLGHTRKTIADINDFIARLNVTTFTADSYSYLRHNCRHFADQLGFFLTNQNLLNGSHEEQESESDESEDEGTNDVYLYWYDIGMPYEHMSIFVFSHEFSFNSERGVHFFDRRIARRRVDGAIPLSGAGSGRFSGGNVGRHGIMLSGSYLSRPELQARPRPKKQSYLGQTEKSLEEIIEKAERLGNTSFKQESYSVYYHNCRHFSDEMAHYLVGRRVLRCTSTDDFIGSCSVM